MSKSVPPVFSCEDYVRFRSGPNSGQRLKVIKLVNKVRVGVRIINILLVILYFSRITWAGYSPTTLR
jgi:hypothetical protein